MAYINILRKNIYYEIYGITNEAVLLYLHGGPGASCLDFVNAAETLSKELQVISFDQYGVLRSDAIAENEPYSMELQADMIEEMRRKLNIKCWSVLGHSYGGALAVFYANKYPDSVDKIILECPSLNFADSAKSIAAYVSDYINQTRDSSAIEHCQKMQNFDYQNCDVLVELIKLLGYVKDMKLRNYLHGISFEEYMASFSTAEITNDMWPKSEKHLSNLLKDGAIVDNYLPVLRDLNKPTLLLKGKYDPVCSNNQTQYIKGLSNATVIEFDNSGHFPRIEDAEKYIEAILKFFTNQSSLISQKE